MMWRLVDEKRRPTKKVRRSATSMTRTPTAPERVNGARRRGTDSWRPKSRRK
jgi:hypothetical protein